MIGSVFGEAERVFGEDAIFVTRNKFPSQMHDFSTSSVWCSSSYHFHDHQGANSL